MLPGGLPAWTSEAGPGHLHDLTAARRHAPPLLSAGPPPPQCQRRPAAATQEPEPASAFPSRTRPETSGSTPVREPATTCCAARENAGSPCSPSADRPPAHHRQPQKNHPDNPGRTRPHPIRAQIPQLIEITSAGALDGPIHQPRRVLAVTRLGTDAGRHADVVCGWAAIGHGSKVSGRQGDRCGRSRSSCVQDLNPERLRGRASCSPPGAITPCSPTRRARCSRPGSTAAAATRPRTTLVGWTARPFAQRGIAARKSSARHHRPGRALPALCEQPVSPCSADRVHTYPANGVVDQSRRLRSYGTSSGRPVVVRARPRMPGSGNVRGLLRSAMRQASQSGRRSR